MQAFQRKSSYSHRKHIENQNSRRAFAPRGSLWLLLRRSKVNRNQNSHVLCKAESSESSLVQRLLFNAASLLSADRTSSHCIQCKGSGGFVCRHCQGTGVLKNFKAGQSSGKVFSNSNVKFSLGQSGDWMQTNRCLSCHGTGRTHCKQCQGSGRRVTLGQ